MAFYGDGNLQEFLMVFGAVYAFFKLKFNANIVESGAKLKRAFIALFSVLFFLGGMYTRGFLGALFLLCVCFFVVRRALVFGFEGAVTVTLAIALAWTFAFAG